MIENIIDLVYDGREQRRDTTAICGLMVHRTGVNLRHGYVLGYDAVSICNAFLGKVERWQDVSRATGRQNAYTFYIGGDLGDKQYDGKIWQALPLSEVGHHARRFSRPYIGIGCIGDFREVPPSPSQWTALADLCSDLCGLLGFDASHVTGHGEVLGAHNGSKSPGAPGACPGDLLDMASLREEVVIVMQAKAIHAADIRMKAAGLVF